MSVHKKSGKKNRKHGRASRKPKTKRYKDLKVREHNKLKNVLKSSGLKEAIKYAKRYNLRLPQ